MLVSPWATRTISINFKEMNGIAHFVSGVSLCLRFSQ